jgi:hypothetical protein
MSNRPLEPCNSNEDPEQWAEIAQWESDRADEAEAKTETLQKQLTTLRRSINGESIK